MNEKTIEEARKRVAEVVARHIPPKAVVGLGTGKTAAFFVRALAQKDIPGLRCVSTSTQTTALAKSLQLPVLSLQELQAFFPNNPRPIDITVDGADEVDPALQLIKGHGGALLWEKIVAHASQQLWIVIDETKQVSHLGQRCTLPIEVVAFGATSTLTHIKTRFSSARPRLSTPQNRDFTTYSLNTNDWFQTDGGNYLVEISLDSSEPSFAIEVETWLKRIPGVIETGFFLQEANKVWVGKEDGSTKTHQR